MTPEALGALHAHCFVDAPWSAADFADLLAKPTTRLFFHESCFLLAQVVAPEAEILTLCVAPDARRTGKARALVAELQSEVSTIFLEVAQDNEGAVRLYRNAGFVEVGRRVGYYARKPGPAVDALLLSWSHAGS